jgi:hypothetical protein
MSKELSPHWVDAPDWVDAPVEVVRAFEAGIAFATAHPLRKAGPRWTTQEWRTALKEVVEQTHANVRKERSGTGT